MAHHYHMDNFPRDQLANQDRRLMHIETNSGDGFADVHRNQCASCINMLIRIKHALQL